MTSFLRFFVLALTPLLGVTGSLGPAFLFGLVATVLLVSVASLVFAARDSLQENGLIWASVTLGVVMVTLVDALFSVWSPGIRAAWGLYLNLLAFSPLVVVLPAVRAKSADWGAELLPALQAGLALTVLLTGAALVREALGKGTITLVPGTLAWDLPGLKQYPLGILATGAGGFFLAATGVVAYRWLAPRWGALEPVEDPVRADFDTDAPEMPAYRPTLAPIETGNGTETAPVDKLDKEEWGETLTGAVADLCSSANDKLRLLVIGSGNGELAYYLTMLALGHARHDKGLSFKVRGVDHFSTRVETALRGLYREHQIDFMEPAVRDAWVIKGEGDDRFLWKVAAEPRLHVQFEVADFHQGRVFFPQPAHLIVLNQGIEYVTDEKKVQLLKTVYDNLAPGGALVVTGTFRRELLPEGMKRTGTTVFRKS